MSRTHKLITLVGIGVPFIGLALAVGMLWDRMVGPSELAILFVGYLLTGVGITVGYHRLFTHRSFETYRSVRYAFAVLGQMAVEGDVVTWVADHRKHHQFSDQEGDPHSPHAGFGDGVAQAIKGLWHAHTGWMFSAAGRADSSRYAKDLVQDKGLRLIAKLFLPMVLVSLLVPALVGWALLGSWYGFVSGLVWGGGGGLFLLPPGTFSVNSICPFWGRRPFAPRHEARNVLGPPWLPFGGSWPKKPHPVPPSALPRP